jgi:hypothetical protein
VVTCLLPQLVLSTNTARNRLAEPSYADWVLGQELDRLMVGVKMVPRGEVGRRRMGLKRIVVELGPAHVVSYRRHNVWSAAR